MTIVAEAVRTPYKGLSPFTDSELDALFFFGRERDTEIVAANALATRLTVLYGPSGVGKSSLLRAGVARSLRGVTQVEPVAVAYFSSWAGDPLGGIEDAARRALAEAFGGDPGDAPGDFVDRLDSWTAALGCELCLVLDQFEELFLYHEEGGLLDVLPELVTRPGLRVNVVLGIRDDELAKLDVFKARIPGLFSNYLRLDLLDRAGGRAAILGPLERYNELQHEQVSIEPELVDAVLGEVAAGRIDPGLIGRGTVGEVVEDRSRVETPYLQLVMQRLWDVERGRHSDVLRLATLAELGGAQRIVEDHLAHAMDALTAEQRDVAAGMFDRLVTPSGAKIAHGVADLASFARVDESDVQPVLSSLSRERILRPTGENGHAGDRYEIYHDVLAGAVLAWRAKHEAETALARERAEARRRQRRLAVVAGVALAAFALMSALAAYALSQRSTARHQTELALAQQAKAEHAARVATAATRSERRARHSAQLGQQRYRRLSRKNEQIADEERRQQTRADRNAKHADAQTAKVRVKNEQLLAEGKTMTKQNHTLARLTKSAKASAARELHASKIARRETKAALAAERSEGIATERARAGLLEQRALAELLTDPVASVRDALRSTRIAKTTGSEQVLRSALRAMNVLAELPTAGAATQAAYSPDGTRIAVADRAGQARVFDAAGGKRLLTLRNGAPLNGVAWARDGLTLATAASDGKIRVWALDAPDAPQRVLDQGGPVRSIQYSPDGRLLLTSGGNSARLWDAGSGVLLHTLPTQRTARAASFSPDGSLIVTIENSPSARVWEAATGTLISTLTQSQEITSAAFGPNGSLIVTGSRDATGRIWDPRTEELKATLEGHAGQILTVAFSPAGDQVATGSIDGRARRWALDGRPLDIIEGPSASVVSVAFSPDGQSLVAASSDGSGLVTGAAQRKELLLGQAGPLRMAVFSPDGRTVATAGSSGVRMWDPYGEGRLRGIHKFDAAATAVAFDPTGRVIASGSADGTVFMQRPSGRPLRTFAVGSPVVAASWARDGVLMVATKDGKVRLYPGGGEAASVTVDQGSQLVDATLRDDGAILATAGSDGVVRMGDATGRPLRALTKVANLRAVALDSTGRLLASSSGRLVFVYDAHTGRPLASLRGHTDTVTGLAFSPDGKQLTSSSRDHDARVWAIGALPGGSTHVRVLHRHTAFVSGVAYSHDGRWIATAGPAKAGLWAASETDVSGGFLQFVRGNVAPITSVAFSPRGWELVTGSRDGSVRVFDCKLCGDLPQLESYAHARLASLHRG